MKIAKLGGTLAALLLGASIGHAAEVKLLNVSYDPTREFYEEYNAAFAKHWKKQKGDTVTVNQSHGGHSKGYRSGAAALRNRPLR